MCFDQGANLQTQAWMVKRLLSTFNRAACRPRRPRSWVLLRLMHAAGIPVLHPLFESQGVVVMTGMRVMVQPMKVPIVMMMMMMMMMVMRESKVVLTNAKTEISPSDPGSLKDNATVSGSVRSPTAFLTSPRERKEAPASSSSASSHENSN